MTKSLATKTFYTASVEFSFINASGDRETKTLAQDVTDEIAEGADREELADRIYWKEIHGKYDGVVIISGGVFAE